MERKNIVPEMARIEVRWAILEVPRDMQRTLKAAVDHDFFELVPDEKGRLRLPPFIARASYIVNSTKSYECYKLLRGMLSYIEEMRQKLWAFPQYRKQIEMVFRFSEEESKAASKKFQGFVAGLCLRHDCPDIVSRFVQVLEACWPADVDYNDPLLADSKEMLDTFCRLVGEMNQVILVFRSALRKVGAE